MRRYNWKQIVTRSSPYTFAFLDVRNIMPHARCFLGQYLQIINQYSEKNANCLGEEGRQSITHYPIGCFHPPVHERRQFLQMHKLYRVVNQSIRLHSDQPGRTPRLFLDFWNGVSPGEHRYEMHASSQHICIIYKLASVYRHCITVQNSQSLLVRSILFLLTSFNRIKISYIRILAQYHELFKHAILWLKQTQKFFCQNSVVK